MKKDSAVKLIVLSATVLIVLWAVKVILFPVGYGMGINISTNYGGGRMYVGTGLGLGLSIYSLLTFLINFLFIVFIVGLVGGLFVASKNYIFTAEDMQAYKAPFKGVSSEVKTKPTCITCGKELNEGWTTCPYCGTGINKSEKI